MNSIIYFPIFMMYVKKETKILTYQMNKGFCSVILLSLIGAAVASVEIWKVLGHCLLDLSYFLQVLWGGCSEMVCLTCFDSVSYFSYFSISVQCCGCMRAGSLICSCFLCDCSTGLMGVKAQFKSLGTLSGILDKSRIHSWAVLLSCTVVLYCPIVSR